MECDLKVAKLKTRQLLDSVDPIILPQYFEWLHEITGDYLQCINDKTIQSELHINYEITPNDSDVNSNEVVILNALADDIKALMYDNGYAILEDAKSFTVENEFNDEKVKHIDEFLYNEDSLLDLQEEGQISLHYCVDCLSENVRKYELISHSMPVEQLEFVFKYLLPDLSKKCIIDVGSRIGAVLYGAHIFSSSPSIYGIELNKDLCDIQETIIEKYSFNNRIKVLLGDISYFEEILKNGDVIILNNVFEYFMPIEHQQIMWEYLRNSISKKGSFVITVPSIHQSLKKIKLDLNTDSWIREIDICLQLKAFKSNHSRDEFEKISESDITFYEVL